MAQEGWDGVESGGKGKQSQPRRVEEGENKAAWEAMYMPRPESSSRGDLGMGQKDGGDADTAPPVLPSWAPTVVAPPKGTAWSSLIQQGSSEVSCKTCLAIVGY